MKTPASVRLVTPLVLSLVLAAAAAKADVVIPSTVYRRGAGGAEFRSDVRVFNPTSSPINYTPVLYDQVSGQTFTGALQTIPARTQQSFDNIVGTLFGRTLDNGSFGPLRFLTSGAIVVSSSVNNYNACGNGSVSGQWLPGLDATAAVKAGTLVQLASSVDLLGGYRTNIVFTNPGTQPATVTAKVRKGDGSQLSSATLDPLGANGFVQIGNWGSFPGVAGTADTNLWVEFTSDQPVLAFASVINNASGDPFAIVMTAEPKVSSPPVASYTVTPASPGTGQVATFTDTSTNSPVNRFWAFGDGAVGSTTTGTTTHAYSASGTYHTALFVDNANGTGSATKDVVVGTAQPITFTVSATTTGGTHWTFTPNSVTCRVSVPCQITWTTPASEANHHGVGGLAVLGITQCDDGQSLDNILPSHACTVTFTPGSFALNNQPAGGWVYSCTQTQCAPTLGIHNNMTGTIVIAP